MAMEMLARNSEIPLEENTEEVEPKKVEDETTKE